MAKLEASPVVARTVDAALAVVLAIVPGTSIAHLRGLAWQDDSAAMLRFAVAGALLLGFAYALILRGASDRGAALRRANVRALPLLGLPLLALLLDPEVATTRGGLVLAAVVAWGVMAGASALQGRDRAPRRAHRAELLGVLGAAVIVGGWLAQLALVRHASMQTNTYDFGLFVNAIWNTAQGHPFVCSLVPTGSVLDEHVSLALLPFAGLMKLGFPPRGFLVLQAIWICLGAVPLYLLARRHLGAAGARVFALAYLLHPSVHVNALWDFHPMSFAAPLLIALVLYGERRRLHVGFVLSAAGLLMLREEFAFVLVGFSVTLVLGGRTARAAGLAASALAFLVVLNLSMGHTSSHLARYADVAQRGGGGIVGMMLATVFEPAFVLGYALSYAKVVYVGMQAAGVLAMAALVRRAWPMLALALAFSMLSSSRAVSNPFFHYTTMLYPLALAWAPQGLSRLAALRWSSASTALRRRALVTAVAVASIGLSLTYGGLHDNEVFRAGFRPPRREISERALQRLAWLESQLAAIPNDVPMAVTGRVGPHAATRSSVYAYPTEHPVEALVVFRGDLRKEHKAELRAAVGRGEWVVAASTGSLVVYRRPHP